MRLACRAQGAMFSPPWRSRTVRGLAALVAASGAACSDRNPTEPQPPPPAALRMMSGGAQAQEVGTELLDPVAVQVIDSAGHPLGGVSVSFEVGPSPATGFSVGAVSAASAETDADGVARTQWTLGTWAGVQTVRARVGTAESLDALSVDVFATARPAVAVVVKRASDGVVAITVGDSARFAVFGVDRHGNETGGFTNLEWRVANPTMSRVTSTDGRTESPPERRAMVVAQQAGVTAVEATDPVAGTARFEVRLYTGPGREISFVSQGATYLMSADGGSIRPAIPQPHADVAWSPGGREIAYTGALGSSTAIYVANVDGSGAKAVTDPTAIGAAREPTWSPDGNRLAFIAPARDGPSFPERGAVFVTGIDGSAPTRIAAPLVCGSSTCPGAQRAAWSPDGTRIAFAFRKNGGAATSAWGLIFVVNVDGSEMRQIAGSTSGGTSGAGFASEPAWSADGGRIAFQGARVVGTANQLGLANVYTLNADGTGLSQLTSVDESQASNMSPTWSPDTRVAFVRRATELLVMNADGTERRRFATIPAGVSRPAWRASAP